MDSVINSKKEYRWWDDAGIIRAAYGRYELSEVALFSLLSSALENDGCVYEFFKNGEISITYDDFVELFIKLGGRCISKTFISNHNYDDTYDVYSWNNGIITFNRNKKDWIDIHAKTLDKDLVRKIKEICNEYVTQKTIGRAYVFITDGSGPALKQISGTAGIDLEYENYTPKVIEDYNHIINDLQSSDPCGRIIIIDGEPGTGKTFLVRGITNSVKNAIFILVPPDMIASIANPQFIPVLMEHHKAGQSIIFIIEDADTCLVKRGSDNINAISSLLNLGDGILGGLFNIKIVATTNAKKLELDPAIMRKGRCCRYMEVDALSAEQAKKVFKRIVKNKNRELDGHAKNYTLGDIYNASREETMDASNYKEAKNKVGF